MSETQTTLPLPWEWLGEDNDLVSIELYEKWTQVGQTAENCPYILTGEWRNDDTAGVTIDEAHRHFIKLACNMHEELVDGCREALSLLEINHEAWELKINGPTFVRLRTLLANAQPSVTPEPPPGSHQQS